MLDPEYTLITIRNSHFNEKARWALDYFDVPYREQSYLPYLHKPFVFAKSRGLGSSDRHSSSTSTPALFGPHVAITDSSHILRYLSGAYGTTDTTLFPNDESRAMEKHFSETIGPHARRISYYFVFEDDDLAKQVVRENENNWQSTMASLALPALKVIMRRAMRMTPANIEKSMNIVRDEFAKVDRMLSDGRSFLTADRFTAADITFASMVSVSLLVEQSEGYTARLPYVHEVPNAFAQFARDLRQTPAGQFALRMFREYRHMTATQIANRFLIPNDERAFVPSFVS